ncbi:hypothetical protein ACYCSU_23685 [Paenibacillus sp. ALE1]
MGPYNLELTPWEMLILRDDMKERLKYNRGFVPEELAIWRKIEALNEQLERDEADYKKVESKDTKST